MVFRKFSKQSGFSLVELMIVVGIIGILSALAIPQFSAFQARARQAEARTSLAHIYTLQQAYFNDNDRFADFNADGADGTADFDDPLGRTGDGTSACGANALGFNIQNCGGARYSYKWNINETGSQFWAIASSAIDSTISNAGAVDNGANTNDVPNLIFPGCDTSDVHSIDDSRNLQIAQNAVTLCN